MSTRLPSIQRESLLVTIALSPFRAIERTRGWRRLGLIALYGIIVVVAGALLWRRSQLAGLPDVGEPSDVAAARSTARVPDDRNAFVPYRQAAQRYREMTAAESASFSNANLAWSRADATIRGWVAAHDEAIALLSLGSARPDFFLEPPVVPAEQMSLPVQFTVIENGALAIRVSWVGTAALFRAGQLRAEGNPTGAWTLLSAVVRASRHMEWAVPTAQGRIHGIMMVQYGASPLPTGRRIRRSTSRCSIGRSMTWPPPKPSRRLCPPITAKNTWSRWSH